jgi:mono/diheme cytochrome c family protein
MTNLIKTAIVLTICVTGCWALIPRATVSMEPAGEVSQASVYRAHCARCHGADGHSNTPAGRETDADDLNTAKVQGLSSTRMAQIIRNGKGDMPSFGKKLSAAQIAGLVRYVKTAF